MSQRATVIQALGLRTFLNELSAGDGALKIAENVNIDEKGVITQRRGLADYGSSLPLGNDRIKQVFEYKNSLLRHFNSTLQFDNGSGTFSNFSGSYSELEAGLRIKYQEANGNLYFTTDKGIKKISATSASQFTTAANYILDSGVPKATDLEAVIYPDASGFLPEQSKVAYRILFGYKDNNTNLLYGYPSSRYVLTNTSNTFFTYEKSTVTVSAYATITASQYFIVNSINSQFVVWFNVSGTDTAPVDANTIGKTAIEVKINGLTSNNQVAAKIADSILNATTEFDLSVLSNVVTITMKEGGDTTNISGTVTGVTLATSLNGAVAEGQPANAEITFTIPAGITTNFFYQIYRTQIISPVDGQILSDIDPGDEMRLVFEEAVTSTDVSLGYITVVDDTPETFRNNGQDLYTNPVSQEGILQANDTPPIAKDIELFGSSVFYANTKSRHRLQISLLGISNFVSGSSKFFVTNANGTSEYTFVGAAEVTDITCDSYANTLETNANNSYILLNSANDEVKYYLWFNKGSGVDPAIAGRLGVTVDLTDLTGATANQIAQRLYETLLEFDDFNVAVNTNVVTITNTNNGNTEDAYSGSSSPSIDIGTGWAISVTTQGDGEDASLNKVFLSGSESSALSIEETARSLIYVINQDSNSPVTATYLSAENDLPGKILFENKALEDVPFYLSVGDFSLTSQFSPTLTENQTIVSVKFSAGSNSPAKINKVAHGLSTGTEVIVYSPNSSPAIYGKYPITVVDVDNFTVPVNIITEDDPSANAFYFTPSEVSDNLVSPNRIYFSKANQPEAVPLVNYIDIGPKDEAIERIIGLRDNLFILKTDGVYILSGDVAPNFTVRLLDNSTNLIAPDSAIVLNNQIYCLTTQGIVTISDTGVSIISRDIENLISEVTNTKFSYRYTSFGLAYESDRAYILWLPSIKTDTVATQCFRYNTFERTWTKWTVSATCAHVLSQDDKLYVGSGNSNYLFQERKEDDRTDFADRQFNLTLGSNALSDKVLKVSSAASLEAGDVIYQEQYITVAQFNRLLRKLDLDKGLTEDDYESTLKMKYGDNITSALNALNSKLVADDASGTVTVQAFSTTWSTMQTQFNTMISQLNNGACDTSLKNYEQISDTISYEAIITSVNVAKNEVTLSHSVPFEEGSIIAFKAIKSKIQWQPMHFGDPSGLKQIRESTIMFDQNNFYSAKLSFSSDLSQSLEEVPFFSKGVGYWGYGEYGQSQFYWGGESNDAPFRTIVPLQKQRCRYLTMKFDHFNAREKWRILGVSAVVRAVSSRAYR